MSTYRSSKWILLGILPAITAVIYFALGYLLEFFLLDSPIIFNERYSFIFLCIYIFGGILGALVSLISVKRCLGKHPLSILHIILAALLIIAILTWIVPGSLFSHSFSISNGQLSQSLGQQVYGLSILGAILSIPLSFLLFIISIVTYIKSLKLSRME